MLYRREEIKSANVKIWGNDGVFHRFLDMYTRNGIETQQL